MKKNNIIHKFESIANRFPEMIAVENGIHNITYHELNRFAGHVADCLMKHGIGCGRIVAVYLDSSIPYISAILGIMKADAIFMPVNTEFPPHRLSLVLNKTCPNAIITDVKQSTALIHTLKKQSLTFTCDDLFVIDEQMKLRKYPDSGFFEVKTQTSCQCIPVSHTHKIDNSSYIITTSGSTGEPKAILGSRSGLDHFISWERDEFGLNEEIKCSQLSPVSFDVSLRDIFVPLTSGGTLCIPDEETKRSPEKLARWMEESEITLTHIVPTLFRMLTQALVRRKGGRTILPSLKHALIAGEMLFGNDVANWWNTVGDHVELVNLYGPSETTLAKLFYRVRKNGFKPQDVIPVGKPIPDTEVKVINSEGLCASGDRGEIYIKTPFMSNGYYNAPELNKRSFVGSPISPEDSSLVYKTGDIGFLLPDGNLQLTGRIDGQIKLHGKRIETSEIEVVLRQYPAIKSAAVSVVADASGNKRLVGYIVPEDTAAVAVESLRRFAKKHLPDYMIPNTFVTLKSLPLTHNGKVDRKALPAPSQARPEMEQNYEPPATPIEKILVGIWGQSLCIEGVGVHDNFFDLGGNSILSAQVVDMLNRDLQIHLDVVTMFQYPTIRMLAGYLSKNKAESFSVSQVQNRGMRRRASMRGRTRPGVES